MLEMDIEECFRMRNATKKRIRKKDLDDDDEGRTDKKQKKNDSGVISFIQKN